jgi:hypothetical protein
MVSKLMMRGRHSAAVMLVGAVLIMAGAAQAQQIVVVVNGARHRAAIEAQSIVDPQGSSTPGSS